MKKKVLITTHTLNIGGVECSFIGLLENLDYEKYDVDVFIYQHHGELFSRLPPQINLLPEKQSYASLFESVSQVFKKKQGIVFTAKILSHLIFKVRFTKFISDPLKHDSYYHPLYNKVASKMLPKISDKKYDVVLAFLHPNFFEANVKAAIRIAWIHSDYSQLNFDKKLEMEMWSKFNYIAGVSNLNAAAFVQEFPSLQHKVVVIENILSPDFVHSQSVALDVAAEMPQNKDGLNILSIGRFTSQKNFDSVAEISRILKDRGLKFRWYLIGYGSDEALIKKSIYEHGVQEEVIILGKKSNSYPYIMACDLYIQPSRSEGKAVTVREAQMLGKPVIITDYPSSQSQLENGIDGVIVPLETKRCAEGILKTIQIPGLLQQLTENTKNRDYSNTDQLEKIDQLLNNN